MGRLLQHLVIALGLAGLVACAGADDDSPAGGEDQALAADESIVETLTFAEGKDSFPSLQPTETQAHHWRAFGVEKAGVKPYLVLVAYDANDRSLYELAAYPREGDWTYGFRDVTGKPLTLRKPQGVYEIEVGGKRIELGAILLDWMTVARQRINTGGTGSIRTQALGDDACSDALLRSSIDWMFTVIMAPIAAIDCTEAIVFGSKGPTCREAFAGVVALRDHSQRSTRHALRECTAPAKHDAPETPWCAGKLLWRSKEKGFETCPTACDEPERGKPVCR